MQVPRQFGRGAPLASPMIDTESAEAAARRGGAVEAGARGRAAPPRPRLRLEGAAFPRVDNKRERVYGRETLRVPGRARAFPTPRTDET